MFPSREGLHPALEHLDPQVVHERTATDHFERDASLRISLLGFVDDTHPAFPELADNTVRRRGIERVWGVEP
jgi:hypothetical protein